jgi:hypothetical protein
MEKQPFSLAAWEAAVEKDPDVDILKVFSFDHLQGEELEAIIQRALYGTVAAQCRVEYCHQVMDVLLRQSVRSSAASSIEFYQPSRTLQ